MFRIYSITTYKRKRNKKVKLKAYHLSRNKEITSINCTITLVSITFIFIFHFEFYCMLNTLQHSTRQYITLNVINQLQKFKLLGEDTWISYIIFLTCSLIQEPSGIYAQIMDKPQTHIPCVEIKLFFIRKRGNCTCTPWVFSELRLIPLYYLTL